VSVFYSLDNETANKLFIYPKVNKQLQHGWDLMIFLCWCRRNFRTVPYLEFASESLSPTLNIAPTGNMIASCFI
jgi:hypothetical protein